MNFITVTIYQRVYLLNLSNRQRRRLFYFHQHQMPCLYLNWLTRQEELSPLSSCYPLGNDKTMAVHRPHPCLASIAHQYAKAGVFKLPIWFPCPSNPQPSSCQSSAQASRVRMHRAGSQSTLKCWTWPALKHDLFQMLFWPQLISE